MADEEKFNEYLTISSAFMNVKLRLMVQNPRHIRQDIEIDNVSQKGKILFVFEGNRGSPDISQLMYRFTLFSFQRATLVRMGRFFDYTNIRVFYYNLKKQRIIEYSRQGQVIQTFAYSTTVELIEILQKL